MMARRTPILTLWLVAALVLSWLPACDSNRPAASDAKKAEAVTSEWRKVASIPASSKEGFLAQRDQSIVVVERHGDDLATLIPGFLSVKDDLHPKIRENLIQLFQYRLSEAGKDGVAALRGFAESPDPGLREYGRVTLMMLFFSADGAREAFSEILFNEDVTKSMQLLETVARVAAIEPGGSLKVAEGAIQDVRLGDPEHVEFAARRLAQLLYTIEWANLGDPEVRSGVGSLGRSLGLDVRDQVALLAELLLEHPQEAIRAQAAATIGAMASSFDRESIGIEEVADLVDGVYENESSTLVKVTAVDALVEFGVELPRQGERLQVHLADPDRVTRYHAARTICRIGPAHVDVGTVVDAICELGRTYQEIKVEPSEQEFAAETESILAAFAGNTDDRIRLAAADARADGCR